MTTLPRQIPVASTPALLAGALLAIPSTVGVVLANQIGRARRNAMLPRPDYTVDVTVRPPWVDGDLLNVAFLGDSLVEGVGAPRPGQSLPAQTAYRLAAHLGRPIRMRGYGIACSRISDVIDQQVPWLTPDIDLVIVLVGANDATHGTTPWEFGRRVEMLALAAHHRTGGAPVVFTGLPDVGMAPLLGFPLRDLASIMGDTLHAVQRRLATRLPYARYIDVRCEVGDRARRRGRALFAEDLYHPNPSGYALLAEGIARRLAVQILQEEALDVDLVDAEEMQAIRTTAFDEVASLPGVDMQGTATPDLPVIDDDPRAAAVA